MILEQSLQKLRGIGAKTEATFHKINIFTLEDLLMYYPRGYEHFDEPVSLDASKVGGYVSVEGRIQSVRNVYRNNKPITTMKVISKNNVAFTCTFFHMPFLAKSVQSNSIKIIYGMLLKKGNSFQFVQPRLFTIEAYREVQNSFQPKYALTKGINDNTFRKALHQIVDSIDFSFDDYLPEIIRENEGLYTLEEAIRGIHFPHDFEVLRKAKRRLTFDDFFLYFFKLRQLKQNNTKVPNELPMLAMASTARLLELLPYQLTDAQKKAWADIESDLSGPYQMNRLIQGDVGSGKTILAILAIIMAINNNYQTAFMAPLEILAEQHYQTICEMIDRYQLDFMKPCLLTGSLTKSARLNIYDKIARGQVNVIIGTHALIQEQVEYNNLGLVITDEQHRFGVKQREALSGKGRAVHTLVMSATPIPRSLAIVLYGDLNVSKIDMLPEGRLPIKNSVITPKYREKAHAFIKKEVEQGRQAYIICPMVELSEDNPTLHSAIEYAKDLKHILSESVRVACIHGKMKAKEKTVIMDAFKDQKIDVLVSTTVIEVGINVPNATVMLIENAERFGLATLHQLRGRIGRGDKQSYCMFMCENETEKAIERLNVLLHSNDGFHIANEDLKLRGPGNMLGIEQSGDLQFSFGSIYEDADELTNASSVIDRILNQTIALTEEELEGISKYYNKFTSIRTYENIL
jgi:ATP-dependent DNA helicase RecG